MEKNDIDIQIDFNPCPKLSLDSLPENYTECLIQFGIVNKKNKKRISIFNGTLEIKNYWLHYIEFYCDWYMTVDVWDAKKGFIKIYDYMYNDYNKNVQFNLHSSDIIDLLEWVDVINEYKKIHNCNIFITTNNFEFRYKFKDSKELNILDMEAIAPECYATYNIGRYDLNQYMFSNIMTYDPYDKVNFSDGLGVNLCNAVSIASCRNPRNWKNQSSREIAEDILGLSEDWYIH